MDLRSEAANTYGRSSTGCSTSEDVFYKLNDLELFIVEMHWPEEEFGKELQKRVKEMTAEVLVKLVET